MIAVGILLALHIDSWPIRWPSLLLDNMGSDIASDIIKMGLPSLEYGAE